MRIVFYTIVKEIENDSKIFDEMGKTQQIAYSKYEEQQKESTTERTFLIIPADQNRLLLEKQRIELDKVQIDYRHQLDKFLKEMEVSNRAHLNYMSRKRIKY